MHSYLLVSLIYLISDVQKHERSIGTAQSCLQMDKRTCKRTIASLHILRDIALVVSYPYCRSFLRGGWSFPAVIRLPSHFIISSPSSRGTPQTGSRSSAPRKKKKPRTGGALRRRLPSVKSPRLLLSPASPCVVTRHLLSYCARVNDAAVPCSRTFCVHFDEASVFFPATDVTPAGLTS